MRRLALSLVFSLAASLASFAQDLSQDQDAGTGELPPPSANLPVFASQPVSRPFEAMPGQTAASRVLFEGAGPSNTQIVIREILVGPGANVRLDALPGAGLIDTRSGSGVLRAGDRLDPLHIAGPVSVPAGVPLELTNRGDDSLLLRLYLLETR